MKTECLLAFILIDFRRDFLAFNMHIKVVKLSINLTGTLTHEKNNLKKKQGTDSDESDLKITLKMDQHFFSIYLFKFNIFLHLKTFCILLMGKKIIYHFTRMV